MNAIRRQRPLLVDLVVVLAIFVYNLPIQQGALPDRLWSGTGILLSLGLCAPYPLRRRWPLAVFVGIQAVAFVHVALGIGLLVADAMPVLALYTLASRTRWSVSAPAGLVVIGWLLLAVVPTMRRDDLSVGDVGVLVGAVIWAWTWGRLVQLRRDHIAGLHERALQLEREKVTQAAIIAAEERARIAREIHDIVAHSLSVVVVLADGAASTVDADPTRSKTAMLTVRDTGRTALAEMRRMLGVLRTDEPGSHAPQPGVAQLAGLIEESTTAGLPVTYAQTGERTPLPASVDLAIYRIVQEALTNVRKHAGPVTRVEVRLKHHADRVELSITDDGHQRAGSDAGSVGHGLVGMRERVAAHHGTLRTGPRTRGGFEVVASLPTGDR